MQRGNDSPTRRRFLATTAAGAGACALGRALSGCASSDSGCGDAGATLTVADVPEGRWVRALDASYIVARDADGLYAYSALCTHQGCTIGCPNEHGFAVCPCHGAQYNGNGDVIVPAAGMASQADLDHYAVTFEGTGSSAQIVVDLGQILSDRSVRVMPPA